MNNLIRSSSFSYVKGKMKVGTDFYRVAILLTILSGFFMTSCEDCYECDIDRPEPFFNVVFIDSSRLKIVQDSITNLDLLLVAKRADLRALPQDATEEYEAIEFTIDSTTTEKRKLDTKRRLIQSGSIKPDTVRSPTGGKFLPSPDSATSFRFPLSMNEDSSTYYIFLGDRSDTLTVFYSRELVVENGSAVIRADSILRDVKTSFTDDSIQYNNDLQLSNETYLYLSY